MMYINALIKLLKEFLDIFPTSELTESLNESVNYLLEVSDDMGTTGGAEEGKIEQGQILEQPLYSHYASLIVNEFPLTPELSSRPAISYNNRLDDLEFGDYDQEVATATSSLCLSTPTQHPYASAIKTQNKKAIRCIYTNLANRSRCIKRRN
ncbi:hypothetical protein [Parasitella parasitica]|uniref:Uncharacterized protein n=1 Tax=Parasitella parasitica TaxID=35722 RepID=A0A0B7MTF8_9FUNG|nr:hypothetical protein [Parasitella parasitica]